LLAGITIRFHAPKNFRERRTTLTRVSLLGEHPILADCKTFEFLIRGRRCKQCNLKRCDEITLIVCHAGLSALDHNVGSAEITPGADGMSLADGQERFRF
jgi:hypothetical protein